MENRNEVSRRSVFKGLSLCAIGGGTQFFGSPAYAEKIASVARIQSGSYTIELDGFMQTRLIVQKGAKTITLSNFSESEYLELEDTKPRLKFRFISLSEMALNNVHGKGQEWRFEGANSRLKKTLIIRTYNALPGLFEQKVIYENIGKTTIKVLKEVVNSRVLNANGKGFWSFSGATHQDRRDWVQAVESDFEQQNFMGMNASDYGGGSPIIDVWRNDYGLGIGHLAKAPKLVSFPMIATKAGVSIGMEDVRERILKQYETLESLSFFINAHEKDHFTTLKNYRILMSQTGLAPAKCHDDCYEPIWCAWGYDRDFTIPEVLNTLPKAKELGLKWAVLDDGWQTSEGDWKLDPKKFPNGDEDMKAFVKAIKNQGLKPRLWIAPLAVDPGTDLLHQHSDMLLLNQWGEPQLVTWWNSFYLCPAYKKSIDYMKDLVRKIIGEWGFEGLKIDGQHLNGVAPCYNKAHNHKHPLESVEQLQDFWREIYETALEINPKAIIELCPCGTSYSYFNMPYHNQAPASDPLSSWQVRLKGKSLKALMGPSAPYAGDHVELSDNGNDFASSIGVGAIVSTKFTWPNEGRGKDANFKLSPEREALWRKWIDIYNRLELPKGQYLGELYDIGFDKPEAHAIKKDQSIFYAFYAKNWNGMISLRGLKSKKYRLFDYFNAQEIGIVTGPVALINHKFEKFLLLQATPA